MSVTCLSQANLQEWREEIVRLYDEVCDLIFVHATHRCASPRWNFVAEGHHHRLRIFRYWEVYTELTELVKEEEIDEIVGLCGLCGINTELDFATFRIPPFA